MNNKTYAMHCKFRKISKQNVNKWHLFWFVYILFANFPDFCEDATTFILHIKTSISHSPPNAKKRFLKIMCVVKYFYIFIVLELVTISGRICRLKQWQKEHICLWIYRYLRCITKHISFKWMAHITRIVQSF